MTDTEVSTVGFTILSSMFCSLYAFGPFESNHTHHYELQYLHL